DRRAAGAARAAGPPLGAGVATLALPPGALRGSPQVARLGAADGAGGPAAPYRSRRRSDHQDKLARSVQASAQPAGFLARQRGRADRRLRHHAVGALAVRAAVESDAAGSGQDDDPAERFRLPRPPLLLLFLGAIGTA